MFNNPKEALTNDIFLYMQILMSNSVAKRKENLLNADVSWTLLCMENKSISLRRRKVNQSALSKILKCARMGKEQITATDQTKKILQKLKLRGNEGSNLEWRKQSTKVILNQRRMKEAIRKE